METTHDRPVRKRRASPSVELGAAVSFALAAVVVLPGIIAGFLRREVKNNDTAHAALRADVKALRADIKKLLTGDAPRVASPQQQNPRSHAGASVRGRRTVTGMEASWTASCRSAPSPTKPPGRRPAGGTRIGPAA